MKQFQETIQKLKSDPLHAVKVVDVNTLEVYVCNKSGQEITAQHGSVENFFESIFKKGAKRIKIWDRRRNGTGNFKACGEPYCFDFTPNANSEQQKQMVVMPTIHNAEPINDLGLRGGMNAPDNIYKYMDHPRLSAECEMLKSEVKRLSEKNWELEKTILINDAVEGKSVAKTEATTRLLEQFGPLLAPVMEKLLSPASPQIAQAVGLAGIENLSPAKRELFETIKSIDDYTAQYLNVLAINLESEVVADEFLKLLENQNLIPKA